MTTYIDPSALVAVYVPERFFRAARSMVRSAGLVPVSLDLERVFADAGELSRRCSAKFLARSLDLLHLAAAHLALCSTFVSADNRQLAVAKASGLTVVDIKRRLRRRKP